MVLMENEKLDYWFDQQLRRYQQQFLRIFNNNFSYQRFTSNGPEIRKVPAIWSPKNKQASSILKQNSENYMMAVPLISCYMNNVSMIDERRQAPYQVDRRSFAEREYDEEQGAYTDKFGERYELYRMVPVPLQLELKADVWTSNEMQKQQLFEQIFPLFNPGMDIQHSEGALDWGALTVLLMKNVDYSNRSIPVGSSDDIEILSFTFETVIYIQPPSYIQKANLIHQIVQNIGEMEKYNEKAHASPFDYAWSSSDLLFRQIITPGDYYISVDGNNVRLVNQFGNTSDSNDVPYDWNLLLEQYDQVRADTSHLRIKTNNDLDDHDTDIVGTFVIDENDSNLMVWEPNPLSLPKTTMRAIEGVIDPSQNVPGDGLPLPETGQRYIVVKDIGNSSAWGVIDAKANDVIEYKEGDWLVAFESQKRKDHQIVFNKKGNYLMKWNGTEWSFAVDGLYAPGYWRIDL